MKKLIREEIDVNEQYNDSGPLLLRFLRSVEVTRLLLARSDLHLDISIEGNSRGDWTPLYSSKYNGYKETYNLLLSDPRTVFSIIECCRLFLTDHLVSILKQASLTADDINKGDRGGRTGLLVAAEVISKRLVSY